MFYTAQKFPYLVALTPLCVLRSHLEIISFLSGPLPIHAILTPTALSKNST
jgi:hypothetical protein